MKLQLYINDNLFNELKLPYEEFDTDPECSFEDNVEIKKARLELYIDQLKSIFFRQLCKANNFFLVLVIESKMNYSPIITEDEYLETLR